METDIEKYNPYKETIKSYTDFEQSKKLAEILPLESADMWYDNNGESIAGKPEVRTYSFVGLASINIPCWSLASLLEVLKLYCERLETHLRVDKKYNIFAVKGDFVFRSFDDRPDGFDNLVDACYETILKLNELKLL